MKGNKAVAKSNDFIEIALCTGCDGHSTAPALFIFDKKLAACIGMNWPHILPKTCAVELLKELIPELLAYGFTFVDLDQIPDLRLALTANGGIPDAEKGAEVCHDYE